MQASRLLACSHQGHLCIIFHRIRRMTVPRLSVVAAEGVFLSATPAEAPLRIGGGCRERGMLARTGMAALVQMPQRCYKFVGSGMALSAQDSSVAVHITGSHQLSAGLVVCTINAWRTPLTRACYRLLVVHTPEIMFPRQPLLRSLSNQITFFAEVDFKVSITSVKLLTRF